MDLSVSIPRKAYRYSGCALSIQECLAAFTQPENLEKCGFKCEKCKAVDSMSKEFSIFRFPKILVVHLKRFYNSTMRREKLSTAIDIPSNLDMRDFATKSSNHWSVPRSANYRLYGISHHSGTLYGGHYIADAMSLDSGQWYNCNDSHCSKTSVSSSSQSAY